MRIEVTARTRGDSPCEGYDYSKIAGIWRGGGPNEGPLSWSSESRDETSVRTSPICLLPSSPNSGAGARRVYDTLKTDKHHLTRDGRLPGNVEVRGVLRSYGADPHNLPLPETRLILCSPMGKTSMMERPTISPILKVTLPDHRSWSPSLTPTRMGHLSTGCTKKPLNGNEDTSSIPSTVYAGC